MKTQVKWRPIKSAPKDGRPILLSKGDIGSCMVGKWVPLADYGDTNGTWSLVETDMSCYVPRGLYDNPKWWMPILALPKETCKR